MRNNYSFLFLMLLMLVITKNTYAQDGIDNDLQMWNTIRLTVPIAQKWSVSMQNKVRLSDDISKLDEYIFKLYTHYKITKKVGLSFGYKFIDRPGASNESDPWAEVIFPKTYKKFK